MTIIISDLHLGSNLSKVKFLIEELKLKLETNEIKRIILNGDIFQDLNFERLNKYHWEFLSIIRKWSDIIEIVWVIGNHDLKLHEVAKHLMGLVVYESYIWEQNNKLCVAMHGHQFDNFIGRFFMISKFFSNIYLRIQSIPIINFILISLVTFMDKRFSRNSKKFKNSAISYAENNNFSYIFCGHNHNAEHIIENNVEYINSGNWVSDTGTIVYFKDTIELKYIKTTK